MSWNQLYVQGHWKKRQEQAAFVHELVKYSGTKYRGIVLKYPVDIYITAYFKSRPQDSDNISSKFYIDGLKGWLIPDDDIKYVRWVATRSEVDKINPRVEIEITEL